MDLELCQAIQVKIFPASVIWISGELFLGSSWFFCLFVLFLFLFFSDSTEIW